MSKYPHWPTNNVWHSCWLICYPLGVCVCLSWIGCYKLSALFGVLSTVPLIWLRRARQIDRATRAWKQWESAPTQENVETFLRESAKL